MGVAGIGLPPVWVRFLQFPRRETGGLRRQRIQHFLIFLGDFFRGEGWG